MAIISFSLWMVDSSPLCRRHERPAAAGLVFHNKGQWCYLIISVKIITYIVLCCTWTNVSAIKALLLFISVNTLMRPIGPVTLWAACLSRERGNMERAGLQIIALFSTEHRFSLIISLFQTSPVVALGESRAQTHHCFINILSFSLTGGLSCDRFCSLW